MNNFKNIDYNQRKKQSDTIFSKYPKSIPIIIDCKYDDSPKLKKHKYIIPNNLTFGHFFDIIKKKLDINKEQALFFFTEDNVVLSPGEQILNIYNKKKNSDNFLYVIYSLENVFGN